MRRSGAYRLFAVRAVERQGFEGIFRVGDRFVMKKTVRKTLIVILALVFLTSVVMLLRQQIERREAQDIYARAQQIAAGEPAGPEAEQPEQTTGPEQSVQPEQPENTQPPEDNPAGEPLPQETPPADAAEPGDPLRDVNLTALRGISGDVIGWISIPDTGLSYPLVQGEDNDYYLNHAWDGTPTAAGSIFMEYRCAADFSDFNTIVYGHRMTYDAMFAFLKYYKSQSYWEAHPLVYIKEAGATRCYEIFAAYEVPVRSPVYALKLTDGADKQAVIDYALEQSVIQTGITPQSTDRILTLSTCTGNGHDTRWVVQAVERLNEN